MPELEQALRQLGREVVFPPVPELTGPVAARLRAAPERRRAWWPARRALVPALAVLAVAVGAVMAVPQARTAILEFFGLKGVTIERVERGDLVFDRPTGRLLGRPMSLAQARAAVDFPILVPEEDDVRVFVERALPAVTFAWNDRRLLLTQFRAEATPFINKSAGPGTRIEPVLVDGAPGFWLAGERHFVIFRKPDGMVIEGRAAGNVLLWEVGELTFRLEGARTKAEALAIARGLR